MRQIFKTKLRESHADQRAARRLWRNKDGATAVEFAIISPALLLLMTGMFEVSTMMLAQTVMESATFEAARTGKTGYVDPNISREQTILNTLNNRGSALLNTSNVSITSTTYNQFNQIGQPEPFVDANSNGVRDDGENYTDINGNGQYDTDMGANGPGTAGQVVVYTVTYPWPIFTPLLSQIMAGGASTFNLTARTVIQNEPY